MKKFIKANCKFDAIFIKMLFLQTFSLIELYVLSGRLMYHNSPFFINNHPIEEVNKFVKNKFDDKKNLRYDS